MKRVLSILLAAALAVAPMFANVKDVKGFDKKVYDGALALYASSHSLGIKDRFICTVQVFRKVGNEGYLLLSAGHCTPANPDMPADMEFAVADDLGGTLTSVKLLQSKMDVANRIDYAEYYLRTTEKYPVMELGDESDATIGDETVDVNFSLALGKFVSKGRISSKVITSGDMTGFFGVDEFDSHGASGSAVIDEHTKKIIGIVIAGVDGATVSTWVEPASTIRKALMKGTLPRSDVPYVQKQYPNYVPDADDVIPALPVGIPETAPVLVQTAIAD